MPMSVIEDKKRLRARARALRSAAHEGAEARAAERVKEGFLGAMDDMEVPPPGAVVSAYWPLAEELDVRPLMVHLHGAGYACCLPVVVGRGRPLVFRRWQPGLDLGAGVMGTRHPPASAPEVRPAVVLAPVLAFDAEGYRLGYGAGYYDRTLAGLRRGGAVLAVGIAYAAQQVDSVPHGQGDERLDWVVTEHGVMRTG